MYRPSKWDYLAETEPQSKSRRDRHPERGIPHEAGGDDYGAPGTVPDPTANLHAQIKVLQDQLAAMGPQAGLDPFRDALKQSNPLFFQTGQQIQGLGDVFSNDNIMAMQRANQQQQLQGISQTFGRLGTGNTTAELNALNRAQSGFQLQDIQALMSGNQARAGFLTAGLDPITQGLQNLTVEEQLSQMRIAAKNAGKGGGGGGGGCTLFCMVLTDMLHGRGDLTDEQYILHAAKSGMKQDAALYAGYIAWAIPLSKMALERPWLYRIVRAVVKPYVDDLTGLRPNFVGRMYGKTMRGFSAWLGHQLKPELSYGG